MPSSPPPKIDKVRNPADVDRNFAAIIRYLQSASSSFDNQVGNAISPVGEGNSASGSNAALLIIEAPSDITYTPTVSTNAVNKTVEAAIDITFTLPERAVGVEIFYREAGASDFKQSYATTSPYHLIILQPGIAYELQLAGEAANGDLGPRSALTTVAIDSDKANIAPADAHYVVTEVNVDLTHEHVLKGEEDVISVDSGVGDVTVGIEPLGVGTEKLADGAVTTVKIADLAVTTAKLADYETSSFDLTATGFVTPIPVTVQFVRLGRQLTIAIPTFSGESNATSFILTGLPSRFFPAVPWLTTIVATDNALVSSDHWLTLAANVNIFLRNTIGSNITWTPSGTKGLTGLHLTYLTV